MPKLMLLDGNSLVSRAFYGVRPLTAPDGTPTNALFGFFSILQRLLSEEHPEGLAVTFDRKEPTFRHRHSAAYKATRKPMPEELAVQMPLLKEALDLMGIRRCELAGWEADDLLGTLSRKTAERGWECVVVTGDKDSLQLIGKSIRVLNVKTRMGQTETVNYTEERFREEYGFAPERMVDLKALMGDTSDNIPGVPGIGEKTAMELLHTFGSLDGVYGSLEDPRIKKGARAKLEAGRDSAYDSFFLATIDREAPFDLQPEEMLLPERFDGVYPLFKRLGFVKFIEKWGLRSVPGGKKTGSAPSGTETSPEKEKAPSGLFTGTCESTVFTSMEEVDSFLAGLGEAEAGVWYDAAAGEALLEYGEETGRAGFLSPESFRGDYTEALRRLFGKNVKKLGHDIKATMSALLNRGVDGCEGWVFDSALAAYLLDATASDYDLSRLTMAFCGFEPFRGEEQTDQMSLDLDGASAEKSAALRLGEMASKATAVRCLREVLAPRLTELGCDRLYYDIELPLCPVLARMERAGVRIDRQALRDFGESLGAGIEALQQKIWSLSGEEFNINSPRQLGAILFEKLGLPGGKKTKTGWSTNADVLEKLGYEPIVRSVLEYRELTKLRSTYAEGLQKCIEEDGRIRTTFQMTVTATGRLSSTEPNLQNIPVRRELGAELRKMFVAEPGWVLVDADYSQIELRLLAHISGDENMRDAFLSGEDVHRVTASQVFDISPEQVTPEERRRAKAVNFGIVYGISAFSLAQDIGVFVSEAKEYMEAYLRRFAGVREYQTAVVERARQDGFVSTLFGRRRYLPELRNTNFNLRSFGERAAMNMPIQGTAADVIKLAMVNVDARLRREGLQARLILQIHDELIVECPEAERETVERLLQEEMERAVSYSVPLTAEAHSGRTWAEAHT